MGIGTQEVLDHVDESGSISHADFLLSEVGAVRPTILEAGDWDDTQAHKARLEELFAFHNSHLLPLLIERISFREAAQVNPCDVCSTLRDALASPLQFLEGICNSTALQQKKSSHSVSNLHSLSVLRYLDDSAS